jgi:predicted nucleic acid-binding protein
MVLIDTSIWIDADNMPDSREAAILDGLLLKDEAATTDIVVAEVLQGAGSEVKFVFLSRRLEAMHYLHADSEIWKTAARLSFDLRRRGLATPLSDLVVAAVALRWDIPVYTTDDHFHRVAGLKLYAPV